MKTLSVLASAAMIVVSIASSAVAGSCNPIAAGDPWPVEVNGYTITQVVAAPALPGSDGAGRIPINVGGLRVDFDSEHVGTVLVFEGGSVGDVQPFVTFTPTGGVTPSMAISVPRTAGTLSPPAALYTRGVTTMDLVSSNHEGWLVQICSED